MTPGMPESSRRSVIAISSLDRSRSSFGIRRTLTLPRCPEPPPKPPPPPPPPPADVMSIVASGTLALMASSRRMQHGLGDLDAGADRQFGVDRDFAFVGRRLQLDADEPAEIERQHEEHDAGGEHRRPVRERDVQQLGRRRCRCRPATRSLKRYRAPSIPWRCVVVMRRIEEPRAQHRDDRHRDEERHRQRERHDGGQRAERDARHAGQEEHRARRRRCASASTPESPTRPLRCRRSAAVIRSLPISRCR